MIFLRKLADKANKNSNHVTANSRHLYPVLTAERLLLHPRRQLLLNQIKEKVGLEDNDYEQLYGDLINNFAEYVQVIPDNYPMGKLGGLLDNGLERGLSILQACKEGETANDDPLFIYAGFSAALLFEIGNLFTQQKIFISDVKGVYIDEWSLFTGSLLSQAEYYKIRPLGDSREALSHLIAPTLARQIMPEVGFLWLTEDYRILQMWLAALLNDEVGAGGFIHILTLIKKFALKQTEILPAIAINVLEPEDIAMGEDFAEWLRDGLADNTIAYNKPDANVNFINGAMILNQPEIFQEFCRGYSKCNDWRVVFKQFNMLGFTKLSGGDLKFEQYFAVHPESKAAANIKNSKRYFLASEKLQAMKMSPKQDDAKSIHAITGTKKIAKSAVTTSQAAKDCLVVRNPALLYAGKKLPDPNPQIQLVEDNHWSMKLLAKILKNIAVGLVKKQGPQLFS